MQKYLRAHPHQMASKIVNKSSYYLYYKSRNYYGNKSFSFSKIDYA